MVGKWVVVGALRTWPARRESPPTSNQLAVTLMREDTESDLRQIDSMAASISLRGAMMCTRAYVSTAIAAALFLSTRL